ncbi:3-phosphoserine/phosphohydroxythreonine transaminase [Desulfoglaeba alkanexedens]|jgi:phosphoserine aminotransferase|uniref:Phosphoserine aminotransferase n=1 Tax=Desulfoglaeba alkanexedens ALDC TaxID=980445 RepID=A0A4P8KZM9_9BACT|nr:3-phosphoserine/phosphohydroxythreonine transaminase [Desulfoglaeba alkanexedens]QCQ21017.1 3-phosphoserine/phosphohydroxythreonine transaminase [Desulfoglaeba alkanexedens ALDC]
MTDRIFNFNPGPAVLPLPVLQEIQAELLNYKGSGMSIMEVSHRSKWFDDVLNDAVARTRRLLNLSDRFRVLFLQGGASMQFPMVAMNLALPGKPLDYVDTGTWSTKAIKEAQILGKDVRVVAGSKDREYTYIPETVPVNPDASYLHITSNNTIRGTQWKRFPETGGVPLVSDMSSDILSRVFDPEPFGLIYAGAQKNAGPAGVTLVILREDMLERVPADLPTMFRYTTYAEKNSLFNTPPCFAIYVVGLVLKWLEETVGGVAAMEDINRRKADLLYACIDETDFYRGTASPESRSAMNVTFRLPTPELEQKFIEEATRAGLGGLKGHRSVGGCRASIYNAMPLEGVEALVHFMKDFEKKNG